MPSHGHHSDPNGEALSAMDVLAVVVRQMEALARQLAAQQADLDRFSLQLMKERHARYYIKTLPRRLGVSRSTANNLWREGLLNYRQDRMAGGRLGHRYSTEADIAAYEAKSVHSV